MDFTKLFDTGCNIQQISVYSIKYSRFYIKERFFKTEKSSSKTTFNNLFLFVTISASTFLTLVRRYLVSFPFFTTWHNK